MELSNNRDKIEYAVMNPSENITILVLSNVDKGNYSYIAKELLKKEQIAEQVGFIKLPKNAEKLKLPSGEVFDIILEMAGNEFCGNAAMSAAAYYAIKNGINNGNIIVKTTGVDKVIDVKVKYDNSTYVGTNDRFKTEDNFITYEGIVNMPKAKEVSEVTFLCGETFKVVYFEGIAHIIIEEKEIDNIDEYKKYLEKNIKSWCEYLKVKALGIMICEGLDTTKPYAFENIENEVRILPLVYVKDVDTLYWESSCASGTTALGVYLNNKTKKEVSVNVIQPSGTTLHIKINNNEYLLRGKVSLMSENYIEC